MLKKAKKKIVLICKKNANGNLYMINKIYDLYNYFFFLLLFISLNETIYIIYNLYNFK